MNKPLQLLIVDDEPLAHQVLMHQHRADQCCRRQLHAASIAMVHMALVDDDRNILIRLKVCGV